MGDDVGGDGVGEKLGWEQGVGWWERVGVCSVGGGDLFEYG